MSNLAIAQKLYNRDFSSEAARQELINKKAEKIAQGITANLLTNDSDAIEVGEEMLGHVDDEQMSRIVRCALRADMANLRLEVLAVMMKAVDRIADYRAIAAVEAMTPEDFEQF